jgi:Zn-dependent oligopeptidase
MPNTFMDDAKRWAISISPQQYLALRNTARIIKLSGAPLDPEQKEELGNIEAIVAAYEAAHAA